MVVTTISIFIIYDKNNPNIYKFLSIGDGLSLGLNPLGIKSYSHNDYIIKYLEDKNKIVKYYNYSEQNISISELTNDIIYLKDEKLKNFLHTSNIVILSIGEKEINDNKDLETIKEDLNNLLKELKKYNKNIYLLGRYNIKEEQKNKVNKVNDIYRKLAKENNIVYINIDNKNYYINNSYSYPTTNGYKEIGKTIIKAIDITST
jgi:hypothetical protein